MSHESNMAPRLVLHSTGQIKIEVSSNLNSFNSIQLPYSDKIEKNGKHTSGAVAPRAHPFRPAAVQLPALPSVVAVDDRCVSPPDDPTVLLRRKVRATQS